MRVIVLPVVVLGFALSGCKQVERGATAASPVAEPVVPPAPDRIVLPANSPKLDRIRVSSVALERLPVDEVTVPGKVETNPNRIAHVVMPVAGRIRRVLVRLGDAVSEGQTLWTIDSPEASAATAAYRQAQSKLRESRSALSKAEADLARLRNLYEQGAVPFKEVLNARNESAQAQSAVEQAQAAGEEASHRLAILGLSPDRPAQEVAVGAPIAGKVLEIAVVPGEYRNDMSANLMTIADLSTVWIGADVPESSIRFIARNERVEVELAAYPGEVFHARVMRIADMVDPQTRTVKVQAEIPNPDGRLRPEMFGQIRHSHRIEPIPVVPAGAVLQQSGKNVVLLEESRGVFREVEITAGMRHGDLVPVIAGLKRGDHIVVDGTMLLKKD